MQLDEVKYDLKVPFKLTPKHLNVLRANCSEIIALYQRNGNLFYRASSARKAFGGKWRQDRNPRDSSITLQNLADTYLRMMGFEALRSNSIFVNSRINDIAFYNDQVYIIFPKNGFKYTWSTKHGDFYASSPMLDGPVSRATGCYNSLDKFQDFFKFSNNNLNAALDSGHEVMIAGPYYRVPIQIKGAGIGQPSESDYNYRMIRDHLLKVKK